MDMNESRIENFLQKAEQDPLLRNQVQEILAGPPELIAEKLAHLSVRSETPFTADEFQARVKDRAVSEDELADIAGGIHPRTPPHSDPNKKSNWDKLLDLFN